MHLPVCPHASISKHFSLPTTLKYQSSKTADRGSPATRCTINKMDAMQYFSLVSNGGGAHDRERERVERDVSLVKMLKVAIIESVDSISRDA